MHSCLVVPVCMLPLFNASGVRAACPCCCVHFLQGALLAVERHHANELRKGISEIKVSRLWVPQWWWLWW